MEQRLWEIGDWLKVNGEAIYGTRTAGRSCQWTEGNPPKQDYGEYRVKCNLMDQIGQSPRDGMEVKQVFFTMKPDALYAISTGWPGKQLELKEINVSTGAVITLLGAEGALTYSVSGVSVTIKTPDFGPDGEPCRYAYTFKIAGGSALPGP